MEFLYVIGSASIFDAHLIILYVKFSTKLEKLKKMIDVIEMKMKKIIYIDMDNVVVDFASALDKIDSKTKEIFADRYKEIPGIFSIMDPMPDAIQSIEFLSKHFDLYLLSTAPWLNPSAWSDKLIWVQKYFGKEKNNIFYKKLILSHHKHLNHGDYLIDDRTKNGADKFTGKLIQFGTEQYPNWISICKYFEEKYL